MKDSSPDNPQFMTILAAALAQPESRRQDYLQNACGGNEPLLREVREALSWELRMGGFLRKPVIELREVAGSKPAKDGALEEGTIIGPYELLRKLGEGGMGIVYRARQTQPIRREVALKIIKPGMDSRQVIARFETERQALALMDHPNIARVIDAGTTPTGLPFFVMGLVDGVPIAKYCEAHNLGTRDRLRLFIPVCHAIQHAHQKGIIHRDIKPSNILVEEHDGKPVPQVIDFGIAKSTSPAPASGETIYTQVGLVIGTLDYMSPEQADLASQDIDTRTDIYALGVVLYELLTGVTPLAGLQQTGSLEQTIRAIRETEPVPPSQRKGARSDVGRELDWIVLKALAKERDRRYQTANAFVRDMERYLAGEPVEAGPATTGYRLRKFARRYRLALATAGAFVCLVAVGVALTVRQAYRADREAAVANAVVEFLKNDVLAQADIDRQNDPGKARDATLTVREALDRAAERVDGKFGSQPLVEASIRQTIGESYFFMGVYPTAQAQLEKALAIRRRLLGERHPDTITTLVKLGDTYQHQGAMSKSEAILREAIDSGTRILGEASPVVLDAASTLAVTYSELGKPAEEEQLYQKVYEIRKRVDGPEKFHTIEALSDLAIAHADLGKLREAEDEYRKAIEISGRVLQEDRMPIPVSNLGNLYVREGRYREAEPYLKKALDIARRTENPENPFLLFCMDSLGRLYRDLGRFGDAEVLFQDAWAVRRRTLGEEHKSTLYDVHNLGELYCTEGKWAEGEKMLHQAIDAETRLLTEEHINTLASMVSLSLCYLRQEKFADAEPWAAKVAATRRRQLGPSNPLTKDALAVLADIRLQRGETSGVDAVVAEACANPEENWKGFYCQTLQGANLAAQGALDRAEPLLSAGYEGLLKSQPEMSATRTMHIAQAKERLDRLHRKR